MGSTFTPRNRLPHPLWKNPENLRLEDAVGIPNICDGVLITEMQGDVPELIDVVSKLRAQLEESGVTLVTDDLLLAGREEAERET